MQKVITGNQAAAWGVKLARAQVISAYPITPQTTIIEEIAEFINRGEMNAKFIKVESEHSAMAGCVGAQSTGARTFTATSAQGLALMHEMLHWASGARLPIVMVNVNRAMAPPWTIWTDQNDSLSQRDTGWMQFYCESAQEVLDTILQAYKIAEKVLLPAMVILDAFFLSHTMEAVDIPTQEQVDAFLPKWESEWKLDIDNPRSFGCAAAQDMYQEFRYIQHLAFAEALKTAEGVDREFGGTFSRSYGIAEEYRCEDAELVLAVTGTPVSTAREVIDMRRDKGEKVGLLKIRMLRPFPFELYRRILSKYPKVAVFDRNISPGCGGIFAQEIKSAVYNLPEKSRPEIFSFIGGLGGRDITVDTINQVIDAALKEDKPSQDIYWIGLKE